MAVSLPSTLILEVPFDEVRRLVHVDAGVAGLDFFLQVPGQFGVVQLQLLAYAFDGVVDAGTVAFGFGVFLGVFPFFKVTADLFAFTAQPFGPVVVAAGVGLRLFGFQLGEF